MNVDDRIETALRRRPSEERTYVEPLTALIASAGAGVQRQRLVVRSRGRTGGLAAVAMVVVLLAAGIGLATVGLRNGPAIGPAPGSGQSNGSNMPGVEVTVAPTQAPTVASSAGPTPAPTFLMYYVKSGDYMNKIAAMFNLQLWELKLANPEVSDLNHIVIGQVLRIPSPGQLSHPTVAPASS